MQRALMQRGQTAIVTVIHQSTLRWVMVIAAALASFHAASPSVSCKKTLI